MQITALNILNLAGKSNLTFSSKINRLDGINKVINGRNISEPKSNPCMLLRWNSFFYLQINTLSFLSFWQPVILLQLLMERLTYCNFLHSENVENGVLLDCLQFSRRLLNVTYLSHPMCHVLKPTFDTIYTMITL